MKVAAWVCAVCVGINIMLLLLNRSPLVATNVMLIGRNTKLIEKNLQLIENNLNLIEKEHPVPLGHWSRREK